MPVVNPLMLNPLGGLGSNKPAWQWQPTLIVHDPAPPIVLESPYTSGGRLWTDTAELQSTGTVEHQQAGGGGSLAISTTIKHSGAASYRVNPFAVSIWFGQQYRTLDESSPAWHRAYVYFATLPASESEIMSCWTIATTRQVNITVDNTGVVRIRDSATTLMGSPSAALSTARWYCIEFYTDTKGTSSANAHVEGRIDGVTFTTSSIGNIAPYSRFLIGCPNGAATYDIYYDDIAVNGYFGAYENSWPGLGECILLRPDAAGDNNSWLKQGGGAGTSTNYQDVDEVTPDDATTYVKRTALGLAVDDYNVGAPGIGSSDVIKFVAVGTRMGATATGLEGRNYTARVKSQASGTLLDGPTWPINLNGWVTHSNLTPNPYPLTAYREPQSGGVWTTALLDTMQVGVDSGVSSTNEVRATTVWALVEYARNSSAPPRRSTLRIWNRRA